MSGQQVTFEERHARCGTYLGDCQPERPKDEVMNKKTICIECGDSGPPGSMKPAKRGWIHRESADCSLEVKYMELKAKHDVAVAALAEMVKAGRKAVRYRTALGMGPICWLQEVLAKLDAGSKIR
jgi:hypothetical protein